MDEQYLLWVKKVAKRIFTGYDRNQSGVLEKEEIRSVIGDTYRLMNKSYEHREGDESIFVDVHDNDQDGLITLNDIEDVCIKCLAGLYRSPSEKNCLESAENERKGPRDDYFPRRPDLGNLEEKGGDFRMSGGQEGVGNGDKVKQEKRGISKKILDANNEKEEVRENNHQALQKLKEQYLGLVGKEKVDSDIEKLTMIFNNIGAVSVGLDPLLVRPLIEDEHLKNESRDNVIDEKNEINSHLVANDQGKIDLIGFLVVGLRMKITQLSGERIENN